MSYAAALLAKNVRRVVLVQVLLSLVVAAVSLLTQGWLGAVSACYGGAITILITWWLGQRVQRAGRLAWQNAKLGTMILYFGVVERFGIALAGFAFGIGVLQLPAVPQIATFALGQFAYLAAAKDVS